MITLRDNRTILLIVYVYLPTFGSLNNDLTRKLKCLSTDSESYDHFPRAKVIMYDHFSRTKVIMYDHLPRAKVIMYDHFPCAKVIMYDHLAKTMI